MNIKLHKNATNTPCPAPDKTTPQAFKACVPGFVHVDLKYLPPMLDEEKRRCLFVAVDWATRWL